MAAAQAALTEVLTPQAYERFEAMDGRLRGALDEIIERHHLPCHTMGLGSKGCVVFSSERLYEYRDYAAKVDEELSTLSWLYHMNHGIFMTPGVDEQWTLSGAALRRGPAALHRRVRRVCTRRDGLRPSGAMRRIPRSAGS